MEYFYICIKRYKMGFSIFRKSKIKIGFLVSYDYKYIYEALKIVYDHADEIILAIDVNRNTWVGQKIDLPDLFFETVKSMDPDHKIVFFEENFYIPTLGPMENETRERNMISEKMGSDCWKLQIDSDEYFLDFAGFCQFLQKHRYLLSKPKLNPVNLRAYLIMLFKRTEKGYLFIDNFESFSFATNLTRKYDLGRNIETNQIQTNFAVVHQSWARSEAEIRMKISNWGHKNDFNVEDFYQFWLALNERNYTEFENFHPIYPEQWKRLKYIECKSIEEFITKYHAIHPAGSNRKFKVSSRYFIKYLKNSIRYFKQ